MPTIKQLDPHVADMIAAGEVVERPASVVKELIENSLDAGATAITLEISGGGLTYIRITDNGAGMSAEDATMAFRRYATSKLRTGRDLEAIGTLGFRGEALAAISAVSRIDLLTGSADESEGTSVTVEAGQVVNISPAGCPRGTTMIVRDLFFNTPARLKFMKSDKAEAAAITAMLVGVALSHPAVSFRYIRDGKEEYHTPGDGSVRSAIYTLLGRDFAQGLVEVDGKSDGITVTGFTTAPAEARGSRSHQRFYVNGRLVKSKLLQSALEQAYRNVQFTKKFPGCVLYLTVGLGAVDVNVHPAKTEVKFVSEKQVFDGVYYSVLTALESSNYMQEITLSKDTEKVLQPKTPPVKSTPPPTKPEPQIQPQPQALPTQQSAYPPPTAEDAGALQDAIDVLYQDILPLPTTRPATPPPIATPPPRQTTPTPPASLESIEEPEQLPYRIIGEALGTYILVERGDEVLFIDKHAAHERVIFDRLKSQEYTPMSQTLLAPVTVELGPEHTAILAEQADLLGQFGFELDQFGTSTIALRRVPADIDLDEMEPFLAELATGLALGKTPDLNECRDEVLHTIACKAAIKAGRQSDPTEHFELAGRVLRGQVQYCPHGRPVALTLTRGQLDKQVRRSS